MSQAEVLDRRDEAILADRIEDNIDRPQQLDKQTPENLTEASAPTECYASGCPELDGRVFGGRLGGGLTGGLVGLSSEGDVGIVISLQVAVQHLHENTTATTRLITTLPVAHVIRLLKGVLKGTQRASTTTVSDGPEKRKLSHEAKAFILGRILISRVYGHEDLQAVLNELEAGVPFQRLWSTVNRQQDGGQRPEGAANNAAQAKPPSIVILTEMDHHFKWMRLQSNGGRLYELYGQLMRRLRALAATRSNPLTPDATQRPLVFVLNSTITKRPEEGPAVSTAAEEGTFGGPDEGQATVLPQTIDQDATYRLALTALQKGRHISRPDTFRLCCDELAKAQCIEPRYKTLLDYYCSLHVCFTRLPADLVDLWGGEEGGSSSPADSSLWVVTIESDEAEISQRAIGRTSVAYLSRGVVHDASSI
ncbi:hypothetical protein Sste5346_009926 [Sporothrix stenoceras]|uniref:Uncharacterized protein n=1 Tax=Sporothrix stenoceras TaxID=5173 RepID=A0ABR3YI53_9PEZI